MSDKFEHSDRAIRAKPTFLANAVNQVIAASVIAPAPAQLEARDCLSCPW
jgi:hypothetical protein